ncbi:hypothetical protein B7P43_G05466 [Cryptotermes secundus]|uniref:G-protein coupled receptors family 1 profile domain-containing protein n=1 Tax=Cryptotermes secundus TaxID=105785 RepID=A0A2J7R1H4_9NEOP|nr:uncharacterized protein LOC111863973 [Cryptotermes secundus]PNF34681.1 hypothetical protein B7P43_G05466 [Cryptotermes secundus]PNF34682.1 hypothetical protein B7P43_G05466 [Cryptotermes secundus]
MISLKVIFKAVIFHFTIVVTAIETNTVTLSAPATTAKSLTGATGDDYEDIMTTNFTQTLTYVDNVNKLNISSQDFVSAFDLSSYQNNCTQTYENVDEYQYISYSGQFPEQLAGLASELRDEFHALITTAMLFTCSNNETTGLDVINMSRAYVEKCKEFVEELNGRMLDQNTTEMQELSILDPELYGTSIGHAQSVMRVVERLIEMITDEEKTDALNRIIYQIHEEMHFCNETLAWDGIVRAFMEMKNFLMTRLERAENLSEYFEANVFLNGIVPNHTARFLDVLYWRDEVKAAEGTIHRYEGYRSKAQGNQIIIKSKRIITVIVFAVGITGNGLLLMIFIRHKETRTLPNSMLINLTVVDCVSLVVNLILEYARVTTCWSFGLLVCKLYYLLRYVLIGVSTYSVVMISVQRFMAVAQTSSTSKCYLGKKTKYVHIAIVWGLGFVLSVPHSVVANLNRGLCYELSFENYGPVSTSDLVMVCLIPVITVAVFSGLTAARIRRSVRNIPGEGTGLKHTTHHGMVSSSILVALVVLFVVSYTPDFLYKFLITEVHIQTTDWDFNTLNLVTYYLRFVNCCLNPLVLFVMSKRYRTYIKRDAFCGDRKAQPGSKSETITETVL